MSVELDEGAEYDIFEVEYPIPPNRSKKPGMMTCIAPAGPCPIRCSGTEPLDVFEWAEALRDMHEDISHSGFRGVYLTVGALKYWVMNGLKLSLEDKQDICAHLTNIYYDELEKEVLVDEKMVRESDRRYLVAPRTSEGFLTGAAIESQKKVVVIDKEKEITQGDKGGKRYTLWEYPITAIIRWMGRNGFKNKEAREALNKKGITDVADATINAQLRAGVTGDRGPPAKLTEAQSKELKDAAGRT